jgi:CheY-like chemotaxis protein
MNVLLVEDEVRIADFVVQGFVAAGHQVSHSSDGEQALAHLLQHQPDIMILDLMLPRQSGIEVLRSVRASGRVLPVLILSAKLELEDRLKGFELGADDYVPKPFYVEELIARAQVLVARNGGAIEATVQVGPFKLDRLKREVSWPEGVGQPELARIQPAGAAHALTWHLVFQAADFAEGLGHQFRSRKPMWSMCAYSASSARSRPADQRPWRGHRVGARRGLFAESAAPCWVAPTSCAAWCTCSLAWL